MRVVLAPEGSRGDVQPMVVLAQSLARAGHEVLVCGPPESAALAEGRVPYAASSFSLLERLEEVAAAVTAGDWAVLREGKRLMDDVLPRQFADLEPRLADADAVIGAGIQGAARTLAELRGIPYHYVVYCPALLPSGEHAAPFVSAAGWPRWANRLSFRLLLKLFDLGVGRPLNRQRERLGLAPVRNLYEHLATREPWVAVDSALAPLPEDLEGDRRLLGFLYEEPGPPLPDKLELFLADGPPPVYVGFGSMPDPEPEQTTAMLTEAARRAGCRLIISEGWARLGAGADSSEVFVTGPVCHHRLFPRVAAVVHHGGAGTTSTAARAGVPQVAIPHGVDQHYWAQRAWAAGVSPGSLRRTRLAAEPLAELMRACLETELLQLRAWELGARLRASHAHHRTQWGRLLEAAG